MKDFRILISVLNIYTIVITIIIELILNTLLSIIYLLYNSISNKKK